MREQRAPDSPHSETWISAGNRDVLTPSAAPFQQNWDLSITKNTKITELTSVDFRAEFFNAFNHPVFAGPQSGGFGSATGNLGIVNIANGATAGSILSTANRPRIIQFALKVNF